jgi:hypothetical protein
VSSGVWWGTLIAFDGPAYRATVRPAGSPTGAVAVAVSRAVPAAELIPGRRVLVATPGPLGGGDEVVVAVWA